MICFSCCSKLECLDKPAESVGHANFQTPKSPTMDRCHTQTKHNVEDWNYTIWSQPTIEYGALFYVSLCSPKTPIIQVFLLFFKYIVVL